MYLGLDLGYLAVVRYFYGSELGDTHSISGLALFEGKVSV